MYWEFWVGGAALAAVPIMHWLVLHRMMAVSGRLSAVVNRLRFGPPPDVEMDQADMLAALRAMTQAEFGDEAVDEAPEPAPAQPAAATRPPQSTLTHVLFMLGLVGGGALGGLSGGTFDPMAGLRGEVFPQIFGSSSATTAAVLVAGGMLVGFGTRMSGGCTSGHGLCGVSRLQIGSLSATAAFFGVGIVVSLLLSRLI